MHGLDLFSTFTETGILHIASLAAGDVETLMGRNLTMRFTTMLAALTTFVAGSTAYAQIPTVPTGAPVAGPLALAALAVVAAGVGAVALRRK
jgi:hypothetical protein